MVVLGKTLEKNSQHFEKVRDFVNTNKNRAPEKEVQTRPFGKKPESKVLRYINLLNQPRISDEFLTLANDKASCQMTEGLKQQV